MSEDKDPSQMSVGELIEAVKNGYSDSGANEWYEHWYGSDVVFPTKLSIRGGACWDELQKRAPTRSAPERIEYERAHKRSILGVFARVGVGRRRR